MNFTFYLNQKISRLAWFFVYASLGVFCVQVHAGSPLQGYVMQIQMTPAVCALDASKQKQRKCLEGYSLTITGLLPETSSSNCSTTSSATLSPLQAKVVARVMPEENARIQLWQSIGGCVPMNASQYFRLVINLAENLKIPADLSGGDNKSVTQSNLRSQFIRLNPSLPADGIRFNCQSQSSRSKPLLTQLQVCYSSNGRYRECARHVVSNCPTNFTIKGSY
ncbi:ribonuclease T2 family protein [Acinetobacter stercoris]|uniref:Ribonuclease T2 family protein n=1 Tax=Acinetobacter stercoris TaxID=2126983 RepID=A0A2U3MWF9_9GAMM|nr:ribonuclease I [Acinetobacter stercoris]SPL69693.1 Ribonuclease T2 family protein [Acinetobacter stercoris]